MLIHPYDNTRSLLGRLRFEHRIIAFGLLAGCFMAMGTFLLLKQSELSHRHAFGFSMAIFIVWSGFVFMVKSQIAYSLRTLSNLLGALREGDYSLRLREAHPDDALGEVCFEFNTLAQSLRDQRYHTYESTTLLQKILAEIDVALFGFDQQQHLQLYNENGRSLLGNPENELIGHSADELQLKDCLTGKTPRVIDVDLPGGTGRWELRRAGYRDKGVSHQLIFLSDLTSTLHAEERRAWQRLIKTVRHEVNNSLTPIQSLAISMQTLVQQKPLPEDWHIDLLDGLHIIADRSEALSRFIGAYSRFAHLPEPHRIELDVPTMISRIAQMETRMHITIKEGPPVNILGDQDQLDQLLINIISNAVEASLQTHPPHQGNVTVGWNIQDKTLLIRVDDDGPGLEDDINLFVPYYTTKSEGSGIGLVLSRQIAEAHGGQLSLKNRSSGIGCRAELSLPMLH